MVHRVFRPADKAGPLIGAGHEHPHPLRPGVVPDAGEVLVEPVNGLPGRHRHPSVPSRVRVRGPTVSATSAPRSRRRRSTRLQSCLRACLDFCLKATIADATSVDLFS